MLRLELWQDRFREYLTLRQFAARTINGHVRELAFLFDYLQAEGVERLVDVTREHLEGYRTWLFHRLYQGRRLTMQTQMIRLCRVRCFFKFLLKDRHLLLDPSKDLELPKVGTLLPRVLLSEDEVARLLETPDPQTPLGLRNRAILELLYATGIRNTELRELELTALDLAGQFLQVVRGKGGRGRMIPLGEEALYWVGRYLRVGRPQLLRDLDQRRLFLSKNGRIIARANLAKMVRVAATRAGLEKAVTPHVLRHSCATHMLRRGANLRHIQELLGHASPATTQRYTRLEISDLHWAHRRFHPRGRQR